MISLKSRRLLKDIVSLIVLVCLALGARIAFGQIRSLLESAALFRVAEIKIDGVHITNKKKVLALSQLKEGENIFEIDLKQTVARVIENPMIKRASLSRILPDQISIQIVERKPIALVSLNRLYGVDKEATLLPYLASFPSVPIITGVNLRSYQIGETIASPELCQTIEFLQQANRIAPSLLNEISELKLGSPLILCLVNGGIQVKLRRGDFPQQILCLEAVLKELRTCRLSPRYIDLRFEGKVVVGT